MIFLFIPVLIFHKLYVFLLRDMFMFFCRLKATLWQLQHASALSIIFFFFHFFLLYTKRDARQTTINHLFVIIAIIKIGFFLCITYITQPRRHRWAFMLFSSNIFIFILLFLALLHVRFWFWFYTPIWTWNFLPFTRFLLHISIFCYIFLCRSTLDQFDSVHFRWRGLYSPSNLKRFWSITETCVKSSEFLICLFLFFLSPAGGVHVVVNASALGQSCLFFEKKIWNNKKEKKKMNQLCIFNIRIESGDP